jgi:Plasmid pRiA4b ORF-3-like protein
MKMLMNFIGTDCQKADWPNHKEDCKAQNYILKVTLNPKDITNPSIMRTLSCPAAATFQELHSALQVAFGWAGTHTYDFKIKDPNREPEEQLDTQAFIARLMANPQYGHDGSGPKQNLLRIIEVGTMAIDRMHNSARKHNATPEVSSAKIRLAKVFENKEYKGAEIEYEYDFGDCWEHEITLMGRAEATDKFVCTDGEGHSAAEDVGSFRGWNELLEAYRAKKRTKEQKDQMNWYETMASNRDPKGLGNGRDRVWDRELVNFLLTRA